jgi:hypothetical protein
MMEEVLPTQDHHDVTMMQSRTQTNQIHGSLSMIETLLTIANSKMTTDAAALLRYYYSPSLGDQLYQQLSVPFAADDSTAVARRRTTKRSSSRPFSSDLSLLFLPRQSVWSRFRLNVSAGSQKRAIHEPEGRDESRFASKLKRNLDVFYTSLS